MSDRGSDALARLTSPTSPAFQMRSAIRTELLQRHPGVDDVRPPGEVSVVVLNGSELTGVAGAASESIGAAGYQMGNPDNANSRLDATTVYFAEGYEAEAAQVAEVLGKAPDVVAAMPPEAPGP